MVGARKPWAHSVPLQWGPGTEVGLGPGPVPLPGVRPWAQALWETMGSALSKARGSPPEGPAAHHEAAANHRFHQLPRTRICFEPQSTHKWWP